MANGAFLLDLLTSVEPRAVNPELVTAGATPEEAASNAKYVLSVARKLGCLGAWEVVVTGPWGCVCMLFSAPRQFVAQGEWGGGGSASKQLRLDAERATYLMY